MVRTRYTLIAWAVSTLRVSQSLAPPDPGFVGGGRSWQDVHEFRAMHNITFKYEPLHLQNEHCRYLTEAECQHDDEAYWQSKFRPQSSKERRLNPSIGTFRALVILVRFTDHASRQLPSPAYFDELFNGAKGSVNEVGSVREYMRFNSMGKYNVQFDVLDWENAENTESFYAEGKSGRVGNVRIQDMYGSVLDKLDRAGKINWFDYDIGGDPENPEWGDGLLDHIVVVHSGYGAEHGDKQCLPGSYLDRIWSQGSASSNGGWRSLDGNLEIGGHTIASAFANPRCDRNNDFQLLIEPNTMGVFTHEYMHGFRMIDLYDNDGDSAPVRLGGVGHFDIMCNAYGWFRSGTIPGYASPYSKVIAQWLSPIEITMDGVYAVQPAEISSQIYMISTPYPEGEYLLIENRQPLKWDKDWPGRGIVIYHIDELAPRQTARGYPGGPGWPTDHYQVAVVQADGNFDLEKGENEGDEGDFWTRGMTLGADTNSQPNTAAYQSGNLRSTGISITILSDPGFIMNFQVEGLGGMRAPGQFWDDDESPLANSAPDSILPVSTDPGGGTGKTLAWIFSMIGGLSLVVGLIAILL